MSEDFVLCACRFWGMAEGVFMPEGCVFDNWCTSGRVGDDSMSEAFLFNDLGTVDNDLMPEVFLFNDRGAVDSTMSGAFVFNDWCTWDTGNDSMLEAFVFNDWVTVDGSTSEAFEFNAWVTVVGSMSED